MPYIVAPPLNSILMFLEIGGEDQALLFEDSGVRCSDQLSDQDLGSYLA